MDKKVYKQMMDKAVPSAALIQKTKNKMKQEEPIMIKRSLAAMVAVIIMIVATTAFAAWHLLTPSEVATEIGLHYLSEAFESEDAININASQRSGDYRFTLMSIVSGNAITNTQFFDAGINEWVSRDRTYVVTAIQRLDGNSMDIEDGFPFVIMPLVRGFDPVVSSGMLGLGISNMTIVDGVLYVITSTDGISTFADHGVYIGIYTIPRDFDEFAFILNEETGEIVTNPAFDGASLLFDLPLADSE